MEEFQQPEYNDQKSDSLLLNENLDKCGNDSKSKTQNLETLEDEYVGENCAKKQITEAKDSVLQQINSLQNGQTFGLTGIINNKNLFKNLLLVSQNFKDIINQKSILRRNLANASIKMNLNKRTRNRKETVKVNDIQKLTQVNNQQVEEKINFVWKSIQNKMTQNTSNSVFQKNITLKSFKTLANSLLAERSTSEDLENFESEDLPNDPVNETKFFDDFHKSSLLVSLATKKGWNLQQLDHKLVEQHYEKYESIEYLNNVEENSKFEKAARYIKDKIYGRKTIHFVQDNY